MAAFTKSDNNAYADSKAYETFTERVAALANQYGATLQAFSDGTIHVSDEDNVVLTGDQTAQLDTLRKSKVADDVLKSLESTFRVQNAAQMRAECRALESTYGALCADYRAGMAVLDAARTIARKVPSKHSDAAGFLATYALLSDDDKRAIGTALRNAGAKLYNAQKA